MNVEGEGLISVSNTSNNLLSLELQPVFSNGCLKILELMKVRNIKAS